MSIVKMKRLRLLSLTSERDHLLARLQRAGCVEVTEPEEPQSMPEWGSLLRRDSTALLTVKSQATTVRTALENVNRYAAVRSGLFIQREAIREQDFFRQETMEEALALAEKINAWNRQLAKLQTQETNLKNLKTSLMPWAPLDLPLELQETAASVFQLGTCPLAVNLSELTAQLEKTAERAHLQEISQDKHQRYLLLICHKEALERATQCLRAHGYGISHWKARTGTPAENIRRVEEELLQNQREREDVIQSISACQSQRKKLELCQDRLQQELQKEQAREKILTDGTMIFLEGWVAQTGLSRLEEELSDILCAYEWRDPDPEEIPPTLLKNQKWLSCINMVTEMYSLPAYRGGIDPNPLIFGFFVVFFGMMFADLAYGLVLWAVSLGITKKYRPKGTVLGNLHCRVRGADRWFLWRRSISVYHGVLSGTRHYLAGADQPSAGPDDHYGDRPGVGGASHAVWTVCPYLHGGPGWTPSGWHFGCGPLVDCVCGDCSGCFTGERCGGSGGISGTVVYPRTA